VLDKKQFCRLTLYAAIVFMALTFIAALLQRLTLAYGSIIIFGVLTGFCVLGELLGWDHKSP